MRLDLRGCISEDQLHDHQRISSMSPRQDMAIATNEQHSKASHPLPCAHTEATEQADLWKIECSQLSKTAANIGPEKMAIFMT